jgi:hypothetical protein
MFNFCNIVTFIFTYLHIGQMLDDKLELTYIAIDGIQAKREGEKYSTKRIKFNSNCFRWL